MKHKNYIDIRELEKRLTIFKTIFILINKEPEDNFKKWYNNNISEELITKIKNWDKTHQQLRNSHIVSLENEIITWERLEIETIRHEDTFYNYNLEINSPFQQLQDIEAEITQLTASRNNTQKLHYIKVIVKWTHFYNRDED